VKILFVTTEVPSPRGSGGLIANYYHLRGLVREGHEVTLVSLAPRGAAGARVDIDGLHRSMLIPGVPPTTVGGLMANVFQKEPFPIRKYMKVDAGSGLRTLAVEHVFDLVHLAGLHTAHLAEDLRNVVHGPMVLYEHNVQAKVHELFYRMQRDPLRRWYARLQWKRMLAYEAEVCRRFDCVLTFSEPDAGRLAGLSKGARVSWLPLAVDAERLSRISTSEAFDVLWIGSLRWLPNIDSLRWFADEIVPKILAGRPETSVAVAGSSPPPWLKKLAGRSPRIRVLGEVDDAYDLMGRSRLIVVPLRIGSGVRVKILEALALRRAVLSTTLGCEGIEVESGKHLVVADDPKAFAGEAIRLLDDDRRRSDLAARGYDLVLARHDYRKVGAKMSALYESLRQGDTVQATR